MADSDKGKLGLPALTALVVGGIIGSGIFSLPQNMAEGAGAGAILIAWAITFVGMLTLTRIFQWLSTTRPELDDGVYGYAREGFGEYLGFNAAWGYWISAWVGNAGYLVVLFSALGSFGALAFFGDGTTWPALLGELTVLWLMHAFVLHGVHNAAITNAIVTLAKVVPIALFILCVALAFRIETFHLDFWGSPALGSVTRQVETTMLYTVWVFLGIESATVYASHARHAADVSRATLLGFVVTLLLLVCVSVLSLGVVPQHELAQMKNPSMAQVMAAAVGPWGATLINVGLIVSVGGALLAWTMLAVEMLYLASRGPTHTAPALFVPHQCGGNPSAGTVADQHADLCAAAGGLPQRLGLQRADPVGHLDGADPLPALRRLLPEAGGAPPALGRDAGAGAVGDALRGLADLRRRAEIPAAVDDPLRAGPRLLPACPSPARPAGVRQSRRRQRRGAGAGPRAGGAVDDRQRSAEPLAQ